MGKEEQGLSRYQYALTGAAMLVLATIAIGLAYTTPLAQATLRHADEGDAFVRYGIAELSVHDADGAEEDSQSYRDERAGDAPGFDELETGFWLTPIAGLLLFGGAMAMFAAPSSSVVAARGGAIAGIIGALVLLGAIMAFSIGFSDHTGALADAVSGQDVQVGTKVTGGGVLLGVAAILSLGGSVLGFSDKKAVAAASNPPPSCENCGSMLRPNQAYCGSCGTPIQ